MHDAAIRALVLKMYEPGLTRLRLDPCALMRAIDRCLPLRHDNSLFVRAVNVLRAQRQLPARLDAARRRVDVVITIPLVKLRSFERRVFVVSVEDHHAVVQKACAVRAHAADDEDALDSRTTRGHRVDKVGIAVLVPQRTRINPSLRFLYQQRLRPRTSRILSLHHVDAVVRVWIEDIELAIVITNRRRPNAASMLRLAVNIERRLALENISDDRPVD